MPTLEQVTAARLDEIRDLARAGNTELTGQAKRAGGWGQGEFVGRFGGMKGPLFPELLMVRDSPKAIAAAIERGKGKRFQRIHAVVEDALRRQGYKPRRARSVGRPSIDPHPGRSYCQHCRGFHTKGQHLSHGVGSFDRTHPLSFSFGGNPPVARLWNFYDGEPWFDNPRLLLLNRPKKGAKKMKRRSRRRAYRRTSSNAPRRRYRRNVYVNPHHSRRRRHAVARHRSNPVRHRRRAYRRNPEGGGGRTFLGFPIKQIAIAGGAVIAAPYIERQILSLMPVTFATTTGGRWTAKVGAAVGTGYAAKMVLGNEAARLAYIVLGANLIADAVAEFVMPAVGAAGVGFYPNSLGYYPQLSGPAGGGGIGASARGPWTGVQPWGIPPVVAGYRGTDPYLPVF